MPRDQLTDMIDLGDDLVEEGKIREACDLWLTVWQQFKARYAGHVRSIEGADKEFRCFHSWHDWCQDLEMHLNNVVNEDRSYGPKAITFFQEFRTLLPETSPLIIQNMMMSEADVLYLSGDVVAGEKLFQEVVERYPENVWGYIRWGDVYALGMNAGLPPDPVKAESIYRMALGRGLKDERDVKRRIKDLSILPKIDRMGR